jgi:hypothetical protein
MRESRTSGSARGGRGNLVPYRYNRRQPRSLPVVGLLMRDDRWPHEYSGRGTQANSGTPGFSGRACRDAAFRSDINRLDGKWIARPFHHVPNC